jgi:nicotinamide-nucleotide amidase
VNTIDLLSHIQVLSDRLLARGWQLATAESCTGGLIAAACTELAGSSAWFDRGFVTYSNQAKMDLLGVSEVMLATHGAVSQAVAQAMAEGALHRAGVDIAVAVTGIAGPTGGSVDKPVGTVWLAWAVRGEPSTVRCCLFKGDRAAVRTQTCEAALAGLMGRLA